MRHFTALGRLEASHRVLDVGCGCGRMAIPLTRYLDATGSYEGFDIAATAIDYCRRQITPRHPNFRFKVADIHNGTYNPAGRTSAANFAFPYEQGEFDFAFATSVFTHLLPEAM